MTTIALCSLLAVIAVCIASVMRESLRLRAAAESAKAAQALLAAQATADRVTDLASRCEASERAAKACTTRLDLALQKVRT